MKTSIILNDFGKKIFKKNIKLKSYILSNKVWLKSKYIKSK